MGEAKVIFHFGFLRGFVSYALRFLTFFSKKIEGLKYLKAKWLGLIEMQGLPAL